MLHAWDGEEAIVVVDIQLRVLVHEVVDSLVIMNGVARRDELVGPPSVMDKFAVMRRAGES